MNRVSAVATVFSIVCLSLLGCGEDGPPLGEVQGQVTMDGKPLPNVLVTFVPVEGGGASTGVTDANGNYTLGFLNREGALIGKHNVTVTTLNQGGESEIPPDVPSDSDAYMQQALGGGPSDYADAENKEPIPARYNTQTQLEEEVTSGENVINLELTSSPS